MLQALETLCGHGYVSYETVETSRTTGTADLTGLPEEILTAADELKDVL